MKANELPDKYKTCDWLWNYGSIGLTKEHIKRLNNAINILESLNEHTDAKYLKEMKEKLLEDTPEPKIVKINTDAFIEKACKFLYKYNQKQVLKHGAKATLGCGEYTINVDDFRNYMEGE